MARLCNSAGADDRRGTNILIDPFLEHNPKYPKGFAMPEKLDLILATHGHFDHIGDVIPMAQKTGAPVVAMYELAASAHFHTSAELAVYVFARA